MSRTRCSAGRWPVKILRTLCWLLDFHDHYQFVYPQEAPPTEPPTESGLAAGCDASRSSFAIAERIRGAASDAAASSEPSPDPRREARLLSTVCTQQNRSRSALCTARTSAPASVCTLYVDPSAHCKADLIWPQAHLCNTLAASVLLPVQLLSQPGRSGTRQPGKTHTLRCAAFVITSPCLQAISPMVLRAVAGNNCVA